ncbi:patatin-like phospholipase family protein [Hoeflea sp.]|uniref:patatin-like phospholipase family protein n=1 Tax=Hoeflea sp. TaxID=1940281 RepID=UPI003B02840B
MRRIIRFVVSLLGLLAFAVVLFSGIGYVYSRHLADYQYELEAWPEETAFGAPLAIKPDNPRRVRILSIEGGALFGLADLEVLKAIEQRSGRPVHELFDFIAGSSTGAIISTLLLLPDGDTGNPMSAADAIKAYDALSGRILDAPLYHKILTGFGVFGPALTNEGRIETARQVLGDAQFRDLLRPTMFPAYSQKTSGLRVFRNWESRDSNLYLWPLITAVTSVPSIFPAVVLSGDDIRPYFYGDPVLIANEPADLAYLHARTHLPDVEEFVVVSMGTVRKFDIPDETGVKGGLLQWFTPALRMLYRGQVMVSQGSLERHARFESEVDISLTVITPQVPHGSSSFDFSQENRAQIRQAGRDFVRENQDEIDKLVGRLTGPTTKGGRLQ